MNKEKEKILLYAIDKFFGEGFRNITMDTLASELKMSKKTIYKHFNSKEELVNSVAKHTINDITSSINEMINLNLNSIEKFLKLFAFIGRVAYKASDKWLADIEEYAPETWKEIDAIRAELMNRNLSKLILQGQKEGYIIDAPVEIIITIYVTGVRAVISPQFFSTNKFSVNETFTKVYEIILNGILTSKGKRVFRKIGKDFL